jgi:alanyl-tRNA synthetase
MLSKEELRKEFSTKPELYYSTKTFKDEGFERKQCTACKKFFWTVDPSRKLCGDPSHEPYSFIKQKSRDVDYVEFWKEFAGFFKKNGHEEIEKYPVVSRWRPDLYFTIASIQDFQRIENGKMSFEYPSNPLVVPQICMRFNDIPNVGVSGRHFTSFMMAGQHAFNYPKEGYWRDRTIELNYKYLTEILGVKKNDLTYIEDVWAMGDFSEYGPCLEFFPNALEMGNNVFTQFSYSEGKVSELSGKVVDVGWGFERMMWFKSGAQTAYDAVFRRELELINKGAPVKPDPALYSKAAATLGALDFTEAVHGTEDELKLVKAAGITSEQYHKTIKPMQAAYAIADHSRTLLFAITDGALPSNIGGGYNLRIILRRIFDFTEKYNIDIDLMKLIELEARILKPLYGNIGSNMDDIAKIIDIEKKRYESMRNSATKIVNTIIEKNEKLTVEKLRTLYQSNGITPEFIGAVAKTKGIDLDVPEESYSKIIKGDFVEREKREAGEDGSEIKMDVSGLPQTEKLYYKLAGSADATVMRASGNEVVLDKTPFYPQGGGQDADIGTIGTDKIKNVLSAAGVVVHIMDGACAFKNGQKVKCVVDVERRQRLMAHHTTTHLINASCRKVLGPGAWQEGTHKTAAKAHIDMSHYEKLTEDQVRQIENTANNYITHGIRVSIDDIDRKEAETKFGFTIYQGHGVPASKLRIVQIRDTKGNLIDAQACGGLHLAGAESGIGLVKIISSARPHDGIFRLEFVAGMAAVNYVNTIEQDVRSIAELSGMDKDKLRQGIAAQVAELKAHRKQYKLLAADLASHIADQMAKDSKNSVIMELPYDRRVLREIATGITDKEKDKVALLYNREMELVCVAGDKSSIGASDFIKESTSKIGKGKFIGGGSKKIAEGTIA